MTSNLGNIPHGATTSHVTMQQVSAAPDEKYGGADGQQLKN
jgi:hypothetical protein